MMKQDQIANKPLNGEEVLLCAVKDFEAMLRRECMLTRGIAYRRAAYSFSATFHLGSPHPAMELKSRTKADGAIEGEVPLVERCQCGHLESEHGNSGACIAVLKNEEGDIVCGCSGYYAGEAVLVALERDVDNDNPNLARVHNDLPIKIQERVPPPPPQVSQIPGELPLTETTVQFPEIRNTEIRYDKTQYPEAKPPVDRDVSEAAAEKLGVKSGMGLRDRKK